jgi:thioredoxin 1
MSEVVQLTNDTFKEIVLRSDHPVVIDFWGPQCVPCKQLDPFLDALSVELSGVVKFTKVVAPENRKLCVDLQIMGLPSFLAFKDGVEIERLGFDATPESIRSMINNLLE